MDRRPFTPSSQPKQNRDQGPKPELCHQRTIVPLESIVPDPRNRKILEDEEFVGLVDSIRVLGVLQPIHVVEQSGSYLLIDGERRWRAARRAGLAAIPCDVWPAGAEPRAIALAGLALNEQRKAPGCVHVARRLRDIKNELALTHEELATQTGLPLDRVKSYFSLFGASDLVLTFCESHDVPLKTAVAFVRYERATNEAKAKQVVQKHAKEAMTVEEINALRKREENKARAPESEKGSKPSKVPSVRRLLDRIESEYRRDGALALAELEAFVGRLGYALVCLKSEAP